MLKASQTFTLEPGEQTELLSLGFEVHLRLQRGYSTLFWLLF